LSSLTPCNVADAKELFFRSDCQINPIFRYTKPEKVAARLAEHAPVSTSLLPIALKILSLGGADYDSRVAGQLGPLLSREEVERRVERYAREAGLEVKIEFSANQVSRTMITKSQISCRWPLEYRDREFAGVLAHELGTHLIRTSNEALQPWGRGKARRQFKLAPFLDTEEGLATLMALATHPPGCRLLFTAALRYLAVTLAAKMSFVELYRELNRYLRDPDRCFFEAVRAKRGVFDTSAPGGCAKDQCYLRGAYDLLRNRAKIDWPWMFMGKLALRDIPRMKKFSIDRLFLPAVVKGDNVLDFKQVIEEIASENGLG
jgi:hypothetical protein